MKGYFRKLPGGQLFPDDDETAEAMQSIKAGNVLHVEYRQPRNYEYHKKFFAMLKVGFDAFEPPPIEYKGMPVLKNFERFRKDATILAGYHTTSVNLRGEIRLDAMSIAFANMTQDDFERLYSAVANVILERVLTKYTRADLDNVVNQMLGFV